MNLKCVNNQDGFFLEIIHKKLYQKFPNGYFQKVSHKEINRLFSCWYNMDKDTTRIVLKMLFNYRYIDILKNSGNGNYWIVVLGKGVKSGK